MDAETTKRLTEIRQRMEATSPPPWQGNSYSAVVSVPKLANEPDDDFHDLDSMDPKRKEVYEREATVCCVPAVVGDTAHGVHEADAFFIEHSREDVEWLLGLVEELRNHD